MNCWSAAAAAAAQFNSTKTLCSRSLFLWLFQTKLESLNHLDSSALCLMFEGKIEQSGVCYSFRRRIFVLDHLLPNRRERKLSNHVGEIKGIERFGYYTNSKSLESIFFYEAERELNFWEKCSVRCVFTLIKVGPSEIILSEFCFQHCNRMWWL